MKSCLFNCDQKIEKDSEDSTEKRVVVDTEFLRLLLLSNMSGYMITCLASMKHIP